MQSQNAKRGVAKDFEKLKNLIEHLRGPNGCAWDRVQTLESLAPHILEEAYEVYEAIHSKDSNKLLEELGDLFFLLLFAGKIAEEQELFTLQGVFQQSHEKMKRRHPHVFGEKKISDPQEILNQWERNKLNERRAASESVTSGIPKALPALIKAQRIQQRAASLGFDWDRIESVIDKLREEIKEFESACSKGEREKIKEELGDILFSIVNVARFLDISAEEALQGTISKFIERFKEVEGEIAKRGNMTLDEMDEVWNRAKKKDKHER